MIAIVNAITFSPRLFFAFLGGAPAFCSESSGGACLRGDAGKMESLIKHLRLMCKGF